MFSKKINAQFLFTILLCTLSFFSGFNMFGTAKYFFGILLFILLIKQFLFREFHITKQFLLVIIFSFLYFLFLLINKNAFSILNFLKYFIFIILSFMAGSSLFENSKYHFRINLIILFFTGGLFFYGILTYFSTSLLCGFFVNSRIGFEPFTFDVISVTGFTIYFVPFDCCLFATSFNREKKLNFGLIISIFCIVFSVLVAINLEVRGIILGVLAFLFLFFGKKIFKNNFDLVLSSTLFILSLFLLISTKTNLFKNVSQDSFIYRFVHIGSDPRLMIYVSFFKNFFILYHKLFVGINSLFIKIYSLFLCIFRFTF